jgi:2'-5' RNA ligase
MRLFTAIELSDHARAAIAAAQRTAAAEVSESAHSLRLVRAEHLHLTLVFIGEVGADAARPIVDCMSADIPQLPFRIVFGGLGIFPAHGAPRVLWLGVRDGVRQVIDLHTLVRDRLVRAGAEVERDSYEPHLTLGRWRGRGRAPRSRLPAGNEMVAAVDVAAVTLFESRLSSAGPSYTRLAQARLVCP